MRRTELKRNAMKPRKTRVKARNPKRKRSEFQRAFGGAARVLWVQSQLSVVSGYRPCVCAHVRTGGAGRRADAKWIVPLTDAEHRELHQIGKDSFEAKYGVDLEAAAKATDEAWQLRGAEGDTPKSGRDLPHEPENG